MIRFLTLLHRWFGVVFCLLFAMWFMTGAVMHWVPFPELSETERIEGLPKLQAKQALFSPAQALAAIGHNDITRMRLVTVGGRVVYIAITSDHGIRVLDAESGKPLIVDRSLALASAMSHASIRHLDTNGIKLIDTIVYDQWTVSNNLDIHRPLFHVALHNVAGHELYVSSLTGEVVRDSTRNERLFNYVGSVLHWIYPTVLRKHWDAWDTTVWWVALAGLIGSISGAMLGILRLRTLASPFRGWMYWHHITGLFCAFFVITWIGSGWLSMDHGRLFSDGRPKVDEIASLSGPPLSAKELEGYPSWQLGLREIEWSRFAGRIVNESLTVDDIQRAASKLGPQCISAPDDDAYVARSRTTSDRVFRIVCGDTWWQIDGSDGRIIEKLDTSRRVYRWVFRALHTLDFPALVERPALRSGLILLLCGGGFCFSLTGVVIGWRRLKRGG